MNVQLRPSDLKYRYPKDTVHRHLPKFSSKPDPHPFNRDDLYEVLPMLQAAMNELQSNDGTVLAFMEDVLVREMPRCVETRDDVFDYLVGCTKDVFGFDL